MKASNFGPRKREWEVLMVLSLAVAVLWTVASRVPSAFGASLSSASSPREGFMAPDFTLDTLSGEKVTLSGLRGKIVVINLWATWCPPCRAEMPALENAYKQYKDSGVVVLGLNVTNQDSEGNVPRFVEQFELTFPILLDRDGSVSALYQLSALPTTYIVDREGMIRTVVVGGPMSEAFFRSKIEALLQEVP